MAGHSDGRSPFFSCSLAVCAPFALETLHPSLIPYSTPVYAALTSFSRACSLPTPAPALQTNLLLRLSGPDIVPLTLAHLLLREVFLKALQQTSQRPTILVTFR